MRQIKIVNSGEIPCGISFPKCSTFQDIVTCFSRGARIRHHCQLNMCRVFPSDFVRSFRVTLQGYAAAPCCAPTLDPREVIRIGKIHWHQKRIDHNILDAFEKKVYELYQNKLLAPNRFKDFDELFEFVAQNSSLKDGHCLLTYDFCLRYGYNQGLRPYAYVYLFRGARIGAQYLLGYELPESVYKLPISAFYPYLGTSLSSLEIEELLCVCKNHIKYIADHTRGICSCNQNSTNP